MKLPKKFKFLHKLDSSTIYAAEFDGSEHYDVHWGDEYESTTTYMAKNVETFIADKTWIIIDQINETKVMLDKFDRVVLKDDTNRVYIFQSEEDGCNILIDVAASSSCAIATVSLEQLLFSVHAAPKAVVDVLDTSINGVLKYASDDCKKLGSLINQRFFWETEMKKAYNAIQSINDSIAKLSK